MKMFNCRDANNKTIIDQKLAQLQVQGEALPDSSTANDVITAATADSFVPFANQIIRKQNCSRRTTGTL